MLANEVAITRLPSPWGESGGGVSNNLLSELTIFQCKTVMQGLPSEPAELGMHVK